MAQREQGYVRLKEGTNPNDACREMNNKGWNVLQVIETVVYDGSLPVGTRHALLIERA